MSNLHQPPVNEVVLSVALASQDLITGPRLPELLGTWWQEFPEVQQVPTYEMPPEGPSPRSNQAGRLSIELLTGAPTPRYWLTSPSEPFLVQVQPDYLALNWRRRSLTSEYVRYESIRERFSKLMESVGAALHEHGGALIPLRAELTYVNVIEPNPLWRSAGDAHKLFAVDLPDATEYDELTLAYAKAIRMDGVWRGRLRVNLQTGHDFQKDEPRLLLNLTARSGSLISANKEEAITFFDHAHDRINETFRALISPAAKEMWGLDEDA